MSDDLLVENTNENDWSHYDLNTKIIRMEDNIDNAEYAEVFSHEYGHFVDDKKGNLSGSQAFRKAISKDLANYDKTTVRGQQNFKEVLEILMDSDAVFDRAISDNMSAYFINDPEVMRRYNEEGVDYYHHDNHYWAEYGNREAEIYANLFSITAQNNKESCRFMQQFFPHTWKQFNKTLSGGKNEFY